jgi:tRNA threonylcarbamoyladenosine biosynthesis protein TsaB
MTILALEFSAGTRSVACLRDGHVAGQAEEAGGRSTRAFSLIRQALEQAQLQSEDIQCLAVALGPGSFTGIRVAISIAQGWQLALGTRVLGVNSFDGLMALAAASGARGRAHGIIDAQRNEACHGVFELSEAGARSMGPLQLLPFSDVAKVIGSQPVFGWADVASRVPGLRVLNPNAGALGLLASTRNDFVPAENLQPIYLRETTFVKAPPPRIETRS